MDVPPQATIVAQLRAKGAIIYAKANLAEYNAGSGDPGGAPGCRARIRSGRAQHLGRYRLQPVRHRTRDGRVQLGIGRIGRGEPGPVFDLRGDRRLLPPAGMAQ
jgi:hypothetical protein